MNALFEYTSERHCYWFKKEINLHRRPPWLIHSLASCPTREEEEDDDNDDDSKVSKVKQEIKTTKWTKTRECPISYEPIDTTSRCLVKRSHTVLDISQSSRRSPSHGCVCVCGGGSTELCNSNPSAECDNGAATSDHRSLENVQWVVALCNLFRSYFLLLFSTILFLLFVSA